MTVSPVIEVAAFGVQPAHPDAAWRRAANYPALGGHPGSTRILHQDRWTKVLQRLNVAADTAIDPAILARLPELVPGKFVRLRDTSDPRQPSIDYVLSTQVAYRIRLRPERVEVDRGPPAPELLQAMRADDTKASLFAATDAAGLPEAIALQLAEIFANEVDFHHDLLDGYRCALVFEMYYPDGLPTPGLVLAAEFASPGKHVRAFFHDDGNGEAGYFTLDGIDVNGTLRPAGPGQVNGGQGEPDLAKTFRRSPLEFTRITSEPAALRYHPIRKEWRAHRGTDYGAPIGTKVLATGEGEVVFMGERGSYGKLIVLRHFDQFSTYYGHLNAYAPGLKKGSPVHKGQVIGYVGMTGLATGPHLHYEFRADKGVAPKPVLLAVRSVPVDQRTAFLERADQHLAKLRFAQALNLVMLE
jgi:hypothetical protein